MRPVPSATQKVHSRRDCGKIAFEIPMLADLRPDLSANDIDEWDSLRHAQRIMAVEKAFGIRFKTGEVEVAKKSVNSSILSSGTYPKRKITNTSAFWLGW